MIQERVLAPKGEGPMEKKDSAEKRVREIRRKTRRPSLPKRRSGS